MNEMMKIEEVAMRIGVSVQTLNRWYKFKKENPKDEVSKLLPAYKKVKTTRGFVRLWSQDDLYSLVAFRSHITCGRTGKMGKYKGRGTKNGKKENRTVTKA